MLRNSFLSQITVEVNQIFVVATVATKVATSGNGGYKSGTNVASEASVINICRHICRHFKFRNVATGKVSTLRCHPNVATLLLPLLCCHFCCHCRCHRKCCHLNVATVDATINLLPPHCRHREYVATVVATVHVLPP